MDKNQNQEIRYRCLLCNNIINEHHKIIKEDKENDTDLPFSYCNECYQLKLQEINF